MAMTLLEWPASPAVSGTPLVWGEDCTGCCVGYRPGGVGRYDSGQPAGGGRAPRPLFPVTRRRLAPAEVYHLTQVIYGDNAPSQLAGGQDIDCSYEIPRGRADLAR